MEKKQTYIRLYILGGAPRKLTLARLTIHPREIRASRPRERAGTARGRPSRNTRVEPREYASTARGRPLRSTRMEPRERAGTARGHPSRITRMEPRQRARTARGHPSLNSRTAPRDGAKGIFYAKVFVAITVQIIEMKKIICLLFIIVLEFAIC